MFLASSFLCAIALAGCCSTDPAGLSDPDPDARRERLACIGEAAAEDPSDRDAQRAARSAALRAIDPALEEHTGVRATGHRIIERLALRDAAPAVATRLAGGADQDPSAVVRTAAVAALGTLGGDEALDALRRALLRDPSADVRAAAARELGELGDKAPATTEALIEALRDESGGVRLNARRALREVHGADLGLDPRTWRLWFEARARGRPAPGQGELPTEYDDVPLDETERDDVPWPGSEAGEPAEPPATTDEGEGETSPPSLDHDGGPR